MYDWEFHDDMIDLWFFMMDIMIIILEIQWNKNWERVGEIGRMVYIFEKIKSFLRRALKTLPLLGFWFFNEISSLFISFFHPICICVGEMRELCFLAISLTPRQIHHFHEICHCCFTLFCLASQNGKVNSNRYLRNKTKSTPWSFINPVHHKGYFFWQ